MPRLEKMMGSVLLAGALASCGTVRAMDVAQADRTPDGAACRTAGFYAEREACHRSSMRASARRAGSVRHIAPCMRRNDVLQRSNRGFSMTRRRRMRRIVRRIPTTLSTSSAPSCYAAGASAAGRKNGGSRPALPGAPRHVGRVSTRLTRVESKRPGRPGRLSFAELNGDSHSIGSFSPCSFAHRCAIS